MSLEIAPYKDQVTEKLGTLPERVVAQAVVLSSTAGRLAAEEVFGQRPPSKLGPRDPHDLDIAVPEDAFVWLCGLREWRGAVVPGQAHLLRKDGIDIGPGWKGMADHAALLARSWLVQPSSDRAQPIAAASLPDIYTYKHARDAKDHLDAQDTDYIRQQLQDPRGEPLPEHMLGPELDAVEALFETLPQTAREHPYAQAAVHLIANAVYTAYTLYGHPDIGKVNRIIGGREHVDYRVPALYHNGFDLLGSLQLLVDQLSNTPGAQTEDFIVALIADSYSDLVYGFGRFATNPKDHDELRSANLACAHAEKLGLPQHIIDRIREAILGTTFDEQTRKQRGKDHPDLAVRAVCAVDLAVLYDYSALSTPAIVIENGYSKRAAKPRTQGRIIGRVLNEAGVLVLSLRDALAGLEAYGHLRPGGAKTGVTAKQAFANGLISNADFQADFKFPRGWQGDRPEIRMYHAEFFRRCGQLLLTGTSVMEIYRRILRHSEETERLYSVH